jgi:DNA-binding NarL/FixJ family response regulator
MNKIRVLLADDHQILLEALKKLVEPSCEVVGLASDGRSLIAMAEKLRPSVIVTDINMPHLNGLEACQMLLQKVPETKIVFLTVNEDADTAEEAIRRGAHGYVLKKSASAELFKAINAVASGRIYVTVAVANEPVSLFVSRAKSHAHHEPLTIRQREVLQLLAEGKSMKEAADILNIAPRTIAFHKYSMMGQLGITRNSELVRYAIQSGLCRDESRMPALACS